MAGFLALIVDLATKDYPPSKKTTDIRCIIIKCTVTIEIGVNVREEVIGGQCTKCYKAGKINGWQGTKWDNRK
jgi:sorbitol-specific phosphotransferase system component IIBC